MNIIARKPQKGTGIIRTLSKVANKRRRRQTGAGLLGTLFKFGLPIVTSMLGGSRRRKRMRIRRRNQKGKGHLDYLDHIHPPKFLTKLFS